MENTVFGVNTAEVEAQVRKLVEVYNTNGKKATLKEWGHKLSDTLYGSDALIAKFLKVLFEAKNNEFINRVLEEKEPTALWKSEVYPHLRAEDPSKWNTNLMVYMVDLAEAWAVYNLPILQEVMDCLVKHMDETSDYLEECYAFEDMIDDIRDNSGFEQVPFFQSYVSKYIVDYMKEYNLENLIFLNDEDEVEEVDLDYLEHVWNEFCDTELCEDILLDWYYSFMIEAVREVLNYANV